MNSTDAILRYLTLHLLIKDSIVELPLGDTSKYFSKSRKVADKSSEAL